MKTSLFVFILALLLSNSFTHALQNPDFTTRFPGCPKGKNVCIYPHDTSIIIPEVYFDFQVEAHVPTGTPFDYNMIDITMHSDVQGLISPTELFGVTPKERQWTLEVSELNNGVEEVRVYDVYALVWRNVMIPKAEGAGEVFLTVQVQDVTTEVRWNVDPVTKRQAKNVILLIGDGFTPNMVSATRIVSRGFDDFGFYKDHLHMQKLDFVGVINPNGIDSIITDSANSASAYNAGFKTIVNALGVFVDSSDTSIKDNLAHPKVELLAENVKRRLGMSVGVVTTAEVQDATPAAVFSHTRSRNDKAEITRQALFGCPDCMTVVEPDVLMGGGGRYFLPASSFNGSNVYDMFAARGYAVTHTKAQMEAAAKDPATKKLLTISHYGNMDTWLDRNVFKENLNVPNNDPLRQGNAPTDQPGLVDMTKAAVEILKKNENGFYLCIEAASIDKALHANDFDRSIADAIEFDNTVGWLMSEESGLDLSETLIIVTADHGQGYDIYGTVDTAKFNQFGTPDDTGLPTAYENECSAVTIDNQTYNARELGKNRRDAIGIYNTAGFPDYQDGDGDGFPDQWNVRTTLAQAHVDHPSMLESYQVRPKYRNPNLPSTVDGAAKVEQHPGGIYMTANLPDSSTSSVHSASDVFVFAQGPRAHEFVKGHHGFNNPNVHIFHVMARALGLGSDGEPATAPEVVEVVEQCIYTDSECHCAPAEFNRCLYELGSADERGVSECGILDKCTGYTCMCPTAFPESNFFVPPGTPICSRGSSGDPAFYFVEITPGSRSNSNIQTASVTRADTVPCARVETTSINPPN